MFSDIRRASGDESIDRTSLSDWLKQWVEMRSGTVSNGTLLAYQSVAKEFSGFMGDRSDEEIEYITVQDIARWRDHNSSSRSPATANKKLKILRIAFRQAWRDSLIDDDPAAKTVTLKVNRSESSRRPFTLEELKRLLLVSEGEWKGLILFGIYTGQRLGDLVRLDWKNIDLDSATITLSTSKTGRRQILPLIDSLEQWLRRDCPSSRSRSGAIFPKLLSHIGVSGGVGSLSNQFHDLLASAGLVAKRSHRKKEDSNGRSGPRETSPLSFHSLRHTATSLLKIAGVGPAIVQEFVGHDSKIVSDHYTHIDTETLRDAAEKLPDL